MQVYAAYAEPDADFDALAKKQADLENICRPPMRTTWSASSKSPPMRCACRPGTRMSPGSRAVSGAAWRCAALLLSAPDMLLLDEPTNHLDAESVAWLERFLEEYPGTVIAVTHDRYFLDNVAGWILELDRGHGIPWQGNYSSWLEQKEARLAVEEKQEEGRRKAMQAELEWVRRIPKGRQAKSKARLQRFEELNFAGIPEAQRDQRDLYPARATPG
jgi:energy-dependent translational throttle protein EttA